jgi:glyoxylase-like metal-dependent hydrolase (beta-lactamase superfamily II)
MMLWLTTSRQWTEPLPINVFVIEHRDGLVLFDTGQDRASVTDPKYFPAGLVGWFYRRTARADIAEDQTLAAGFSRLGYRLSDVSKVILSHLHQDHIGGLAEFYGASIYVSQTEWATLAGRDALLNGLMRNHIELPGLNWKRFTPEPASDRGLEPFTASYDLFGDGSLVLIPTPGHTPGSVSLIVRQPGKPTLAIVGDLTFSKDLLESDHVPGAGSRGQLQETTAKIKQLRHNLGGLVVLATHDPAAAAQLEKSLGT